ncbi:hypothetical protein ES708_11383 [subsurface metagenome]
MLIADPKELSDACRVLFGSDVEINQELLRHLQTPKLKLAYRKKVFETHPDRANALGQDETVMNEMFQEVTWAYEKLRSVLNEDGTITAPSTAPLHQKKERAARSKDPFREIPDHYYKGALPRRKLLLGQYLYYSGIISWRTLIKAVVWQRTHRPLMGQIAVKWGMLTPRDIREILNQKSFREKFGEFAMRNGYITPFNLMALLGR